MPRILLITRGVPGPKSLHLGIFERDQAKALIHAGMDVMILSMDFRSLRHQHTLGTRVYQEEGILHYHVSIPLGRSPEGLRTWLGCMMIKRTYNRMEKAEGPVHLLHAHFPGPAYLGAMLKQHTKLPLVVTEHSSRLLEPSWWNPYRKKKLCTAYRAADRLLAVSGPLAEAMTALTGEVPEVVPNLYDEQLFFYEEREEREELFVCTGHLLVEKGMLELVEAFHHAFRNHREITLRIFGEGPLRPLLEEKIQNLRMEDRIHLHGAVPRQELSSWYRKARWFVLASWKETFGVAYLEALASGLPVVGTQCGGPEDFVTRNRGILVPPKDVKALAEAMQMIRKRPVERKNLAAEIKDTYSAAPLVAHLASIYERILNSSDK